MSTNSRPQLKGVSGPSDAEASHCRRVALWAAELARACRCTKEDRVALEQAALYHHFPPILLSASSRAGLFQDLGLQADHHEEILPEMVREILGAFHHLKGISAGPASAYLATLLEIANALDEYFEWEPVSGRQRMDERAVVAFRTLRAVVEDPAALIHSVPQPTPAQHAALRLMTSSDANRSDIEAVAHLDPTVAQGFLRAAGVARSRTGVAAGVRAAIAAIGRDRAKSVLCAAAMRPFFSRPVLRPAWNHSLRSAQTAERLALKLPDIVDPNEAFLAGLLHDAGRLPMAFLPPGFQRRFRRMFQGGCDAVLAERVFCGFDHPGVGRLLVKGWKVPSGVAAAVEFHHRPERSASKLAALVCAAEELDHPSDDLPSILRRESARETLGLNEAAVVGGAASGPLDALRFAR